MLGGILIPAIKEPGTPMELYKARFDVQVHRDIENEYKIHTLRPFLNRNTRLIMSIIASVKYHNVWVQDVTHAYIQVYDLEWDVYIKAAAQFQLPTDTYLKLLKTNTEFQNLKPLGSKSTIFSCTKMSNLLPRTATLHLLT